MYLGRIKYKTIGLLRNVSNYILGSSQIGTRLNSVVFDSGNSNVTVYRSWYSDEKRFTTIFLNILWC